MPAVEIYNQHGKSTVFSKTRNLHFHGRGHVFRRKRFKKNIKSELLNVVYGCLDVNFADAGHGNGPSLHTYTDRCRFREGRFSHVCLLFHGLRQGKRCWTRRGFETSPFAHPSIHTYIHTYIQKNLQLVNSVLHHLKTKISCMFANAGRGIIQPTWKIVGFLENPKSPFPWQGPRFHTKTSKQFKK